MKTTNGGNNWIRLISNIGLMLNETFFTSIDTGYVIGIQGKILKTTNAGVNWIEQISNSMNKLNSIYFIDAYTGIISTDIRTIRTTNGGTNWAVLTQGRGTDIYFYDNENGICVGGTGEILKSTNSGLNWFTIQTFGVSENLNSVHFTDIINGITVGDEGTIFKTTNGGNNWVKLIPPSTNYFYSVSFTNQNTGYIAGDFGTILKTTNGGMTFIKNQTTVSNSNDYQLFQNYPNPFNPSTNISYKITKSSDVKLVVYDLLGKEIETLINMKQSLGLYDVNFMGSNLPSGVYLYSLFVNQNLVETKKLLLTK